ncbi:hypothetical protein DFAR_2880006 [Desulfarculales bacterium]
MRTSLAQVQQLSGRLPFCAHCKKTRDDQGYWQRIETYIMKHSETYFGPRHLPRVRLGNLPRPDGRGLPNQGQAIDQPTLRLGG